MNGHTDHGSWCWTVCTVAVGDLLANITGVWPQDRQKVKLTQTLRLLRLIRTSVTTTDLSISLTAVARLENYTRNRASRLRKPCCFPKSTQM